MGFLIPADALAGVDVYTSFWYLDSQKNLEATLEALVTRHPDCVELLDNPKDRERCKTIFKQWKRKEMPQHVRGWYEDTVELLRQIIKGQRCG